MVRSVAESLSKLKGEIIEGMISYREGDGGGFDPGYSEDDVEVCARILDEYLSSVLVPSIRGDSSGIMSAVEVAVLALNELNERCDGGLIETEQREGICALIIGAAAEAGLVSAAYDITEAWRAW